MSSYENKVVYFVEMSTCYPKSEVLAFHLYVSNVEQQMRLSSMCYEIALVQPRYG
jgi:hypothetical protein